MQMSVRVVAVVDLVDRIKNWMVAVAVAAGYSAQTKKAPLIADYYDYYSVQKGTLTAAVLVLVGQRERAVVVAAGYWRPGSVRRSRTRWSMLQSSMIQTRHQYLTAQRRL